MFLVIKIQSADCYTLIEFSDILEFIIIKHVFFHIFFFGFIATSEIIHKILFVGVVKLVHGTGHLQCMLFICHIFFCFFTPLSLGT